jgi:hypothetical protein
MLNVQVPTSPSGLVFQAHDQNQRIDKLSSDYTPSKGNTLRNFNLDKMVRALILSCPALVHLNYLEEETLLP